MENNLLI